MRVGFVLMFVLLFNVAAQVESQYQKLDVLVGLISTDSVQDLDFVVEKQFALQVLSVFSNFGECGVKVAMINYGKQAEIAWDFSSPIASNISMIESELTALEPIGGDLASMVPVLELATNQVFSGNGDRPDVPNVFVLINSEGSDSTTGLKAAAAQLHRVSSVMVIGVTNQINMTELEIIAGHSRNIYTVLDYYAITTALQDMVKDYKECSDCPPGYSDKDVKPGQSYYTITIKRKEKTTSTSGDDVVSPKKSVTLSPAKCIYVEGSDEFYVNKFCITTKFAKVIRFRGFNKAGKRILWVNVLVTGDGKTFTETCETLTERKNSKLLKSMRVAFGGIGNGKNVVAKNFHMDACGKK